MLVYLRGCFGSSIAVIISLTQLSNWSLQYEPNSSLSSVASLLKPLNPDKSPNRLSAVLSVSFTWNYKITILYTKKLMPSQKYKIVFCTVNMQYPNLISSYSHTACSTHQEKLITFVSKKFIIVNKGSWSAVSQLHQNNSSHFSILPENIYKCMWGNVEQGTYGTIRTLIWKPLSELRLIKTIFLLTSANTDHKSVSGAKTWFTHLRVKLSDPYNVIDNLRHVTSLRGTTTILSTWVRILSLWNEVIPNALHIHSQLTKQCFSKTRCK